MLKIKSFRRNSPICNIIPKSGLWRRKPISAMPLPGPVD